MYTRYTPTMLALTAALTAGCGQSAGDFSVPDRTAITQSSSQYLDALVAGDWDSYAELFTANAQQLTGGGGLLEGRGEIRDYVQQMEVDFVESETSNVLVGGSGDLAYRWMDYSLTFTSQPAADSTMQSTLEGRLLSVYQRQDDGSWLIVADTWSPQGPTTMTAEASS